MAAYLLYLNASPCYLRLKALLEIPTWYPKRYSADTGREKNTPVSQNLRSWFQAEHPLAESRTDGLRRGGQECASCQQLSFLGGSWEWQGDSLPGTVWGRPLSRSEFGIALRRWMKLLLKTCFSPPAIPMQAALGFLTWGLATSGSRWPSRRFIKTLLRLCHLCFLLHDYGFCEVQHLLG